MVIYLGMVPKWYHMVPKWYHYKNMKNNSYQLHFRYDNLIRKEIEYIISRNNLDVNDVSQLIRKLIRDKADQERKDDINYLIPKR